MLDVAKNVPHVRGTAHGLVKLTVTQVVEIYLAPDKHEYLAAVHNVGTTCIRLIKQGRTWRHITILLGVPPGRVNRPSGQTKE